MKKYIAILAFLCFAVSLSAQYRTQVFTDAIKTLQVHNTGDWRDAPIIGLHSGETIDISFDLLSISPEYYTYKIIHCDADWKPSRLAEAEYMTGLQYNQVDDYANSFNTQPDYVNYKLTLPNSNNQLKVSGNYVVSVYNQEDEYPILNACFSVVDPRLGINMQVSPITDKGVHSKYQAVSLEVSYGDDVQSPTQDFKVYVFQNNRTDNQAALLKPMSLQNRKAIYDHNPALIFDGGNEYRVFEMTTTQFNGLNIETYEYHSPFYHAILKPDGIRANRAYSYVGDINGRYLIKTQRYDDDDLESDYRIVHFYLPCQQPFAENVYILSEAFCNRLDANSQMEYSPVDQGYIKSVLLKEGYYNYLYVTRKTPDSPASTELIEGNHYETENEYRAMIYFRPFGSRYDQLIGIQTVEFK